ncbi:major facilitator superfamily domain-containing protein 12-like [Bacillus rossius redtenbacheri]|uniref:major facilitator superfamily domain-containing protein 12-like n=1 Tax=Bacillus rossius redtenbacheri TaxID=93214 RepID=UPI002FDEB15A
MDESSALLGDPRRALSARQRAAYGLGHVLNDICASMWFSYMLLFFQVAIGMDAAVSGAMMLLGQVVDALATPVAGILSDRYGDRRIWHIAGSVVVTASFPLMFTQCPGCESHLSTAAYYGVLITVFQVGWAFVQISHLSLLTDLTPHKEERAHLTSVRYTASVCASVSVYLVTWVVFHTTKTSAADRIMLGDSYKFLDIVLVGTGIGILATVLFHLGVRDARAQTRNSAVGTAATWEGCVDYFRSPLLLQVAFLYVASRMFLTLSMVYIPLYLDEGISEESEILATVPLVAYIASFLASLGIKYLSNFCGNKVIYLIGAVASTAACIWVNYGSGDNYKTYQIYMVAVLFGAGSSITLVSSLCITADLIGTHTEQGAFVYSIVTFSDKLFNGIIIMIIEALECASQELCPNYYHDVLVYVCGGSALVGLLVLATLRNVSVDRAAPATIK